MAEVTIKAHTRRGKNGKTVQVRGYSRRVGRKGIHSPKREKSVKSGEEFEQKMAEREHKRILTPEEIAAQKEVMEGFKRAESEMKSLGMTREQYSRYKLAQSKKGGNKSDSHAREVKNPLSPKGSLGILERVEDKIAKFVEKYSGKTYKRQL